MKNVYTNINILYYKYNKYMYQYNGLKYNIHCISFITLYYATILKIGITKQMLMKIPRIQMKL